MTSRIISSRKKKEFRIKCDSRGHSLLSDTFPELATGLESIFESGASGIAGGRESHPRLTSDLLYRSTDNNSYMWQARETLLKVAPPQFAISLSSCYNYTESYKENTFAARRHHADQNINAKISFKHPPRNVVYHDVPNLHWSTKSVYLLLEKAEEVHSDCVIDSRDAKAIVCGNIQPVQKPGRSWKLITYEDHTFNQSRTNAVVPMTHLFMDPNHQEKGRSEKEFFIRRTGIPVTLVNLGLCEPQTTFRAMNEILFMLTLPSLNSIFRQAETGSCLLLIMATVKTWTVL